MNARQLSETDDFATYGTLSHSGTRVARELRIHKNECASECAGVWVCVCVVTVSQRGKCKRFSGKRNACVDQKRTNELSTEFSTLSEADRRQLEARRGQGEGEGRRASAPPHCCEHAFGIGNKHQTHVQPARHSLRVYAVVVVSAHDTYTQASISVCVCVWNVISGI